jgi:MoaA/NifB/PqqE/SkfB family radical SAM enzyme
MKQIKREFDDKPIACHFYVTDQCNLDCFYCSEYDNSVPHPSLADLKKWIGKISELGCIRIGLQGGEPLMHPDIVEVVRHCKELGLRASMSTNGFLLNEKLIEQLEKAGLDSLQLSVDRMTPIPSTRKSLKTIIPKIAVLKKFSIPFNITGVLFNESIEEARKVLEYGLSHDIPTHARLVHAGPDGFYSVEPGDKENLDALLDFQIEQKKKGKKVYSTDYLFDYQKSLLFGEETDWTCVAGYKYFFVSAQGKFWLCSMNRQPNVDLMDVTPDLLRSYYHKKDCQTNCGVYCVVSESLAFKEPVRFAAREVRARLKGKLARLKNGKSSEAPSLGDDDSSATSESLRVISG